jgi:hypothetical protein
MLRGNAPVRRAAGEVSGGDFGTLRAQLSQLRLERDTLALLLSWYVRNAPVLPPGSSLV